MSGARGGWNALLLVAPAVPLRVLTGGRQPTDGQTRLRVLGARHVPQAAGPSARVATSRRADADPRQTPARVRVAGRVEGRRRRRSTRSGTCASFMSRSRAYSS
jgi:hypothetical protein